MSKFGAIFVNLPVRDLSRSMAFFRNLGFTFDERFTNDMAACLVIGSNMYAMLVTHAKFQEFTPRTICDATQQTEVLLALSLSSREAVDAMMQQVEAAGGRRIRGQDHGFMYEQAFQDLDGHIWEAFWMDPAVLEQKKSTTA